MVSALSWRIIRRIALGFWEAPQPDPYFASERTATPDPPRIVGDNPERTPQKPVIPPFRPTDRGQTSRNTLLAELMEGP